ncbi:competence/damage-inducible protein A [Chungangia koreensis]|uniref:Putative competence-damage inducible protein n=1 Tax=Chungangia koreensis TaxID=752657 RepID=A0ABV8X266_9LACT
MMNAEIIAVGSELLLGQIANTNAKFISNQLAELGVNVYYHTVVGDNGIRLDQAITIAESRADLIIFSGGLGPTKDDLTKETIAKHLSVELMYNQAALHSIEAFFNRLNRPMTENNRKQALVLNGSKVLVNHHGMAPGMIYEQEGRTYILLPGPPKELEPMFQFEAKPFLAKKVGGYETIKSLVLRFYGIGEAELEHKIEDLLDAQENPTIAPLASDGEVTLRITAKANSEIEAAKLISSAKTAILERVGDFQYGIDDDSLTSKAAELLMEKGLTISAAESLTAGLFQSELAEIPGISSTLVGGIVTYTEQAKIHQLGVAQEVIERHGVVSKECAMEMAVRVKQKFGTDIGVGLTGAAGPEMHDGQPVGTVWIAIVLNDEEPVAYQLKLSGMRNTNRLRAVKSTMNYLIKILKQLP